MTPGDYLDRVEEIFVEALGATGDAREVLLERRCGGDAALRADIESLLAAHERAPSQMQAVTVERGRAEDLHRLETTGARVGPFRLIERIGSGGMGIVYRAARDEGDFHQEVAIKLTHISLRDAAALRRFKAERRILAELHHPHIVTLVDGGVTAEGLAWLAMEYVDGTPIATYCRDHRLTLEQRLRLFQRVCSAVQFAHRHLVVHRDLKPANILVTDDGVPKVLDFGVAKLLEPERGHTETLTLMPAPLTPNYASPEQLRGLKVTTASDIYALGVLLYELLTGCRPYETRDKPLDQLLQLVTDGSARRPSDARPDRHGHTPYDLRRLRGDLDAVVLKAMRVNPDSRYASADELSDDVDRFLNGRPVVACDPTIRYLASKMLAKYRVPAAAAAIVLAAVVASLGLALWQWRMATFERARAVQRGAETRGIARALIFKIHDAVVPLPGSTPVRQMLVAEALSYLDRLAADSRGDADLQLEVARAYRQVADLQGNPGMTNLGDRDGAVASFEKALAVLRPLTTIQDPDPVHLTAYAESASRLATTLHRMAGRLLDARRVSWDTLRVAEQLVRVRPADEDARDLLASAHWNLATTLEPAEAEKHWLKSRDLYASYLASEPDTLRWRGSLVQAESHIASFYEANGTPVKARAHLQRVVEITAEVPEWHGHQPNAPRQRQVDVADMISVSGNALLKLGDPAAAAEHLRRSLEIRRAIAEIDPKNVYVWTRVADNYSSLARAYELLGLTADAIAHARLAVRTFDGLRGDEIIVQPILGRALIQLGVLGWSSANRDEACASLRRAVDIYARLGHDGRLTPMDHRQQAEAARRFAACTGGRPAVRAASLPN